MSDITPNWLDDPDDPAEQANNPLREAREAARRQRARANELETDAARTADVERELAFVKAGVDTDSEMGKIFARGYDGELTKEAITAAVAGMNLSAAVAPEQPADAQPEDTVLEPGEADLLTGAETLSGQAPNSDPPPADPYQEAAKVFNSATEDGMPSDEALGLSFNSLANAAAAGDKRVVIPQTSRQAVPG